MTHKYNFESKSYIDITITRFCDELFTSHHVINIPNVTIRSITRNL